MLNPKSPVAADYGLVWNMTTVLRPLNQTCVVKVGQSHTETRISEGQESTSVLMGSCLFFLSASKHRFGVQNFGTLVEITGRILKCLVRVNDFRAELF